MTENNPEPNVMQGAPVPAETPPVEVAPDAAPDAPPVEAAPDDAGDGASTDESGTQTEETDPVVGDDDGE